MKLACWSVMLAVLVVASLPQSSCGQDASDSEVQAESGRQSGRRGRGAPRYRSDLTLRDFRAHDPFIVAYAPEQTYYLYSGTRVDRGRAGVVAYKSKDLRTWEGPQVVFAVPDDIWANPRHGAWAPEVHEYRGKYYLFVTLHNRDEILAKPPDVWRVNHLRGTVIARADTPAGPFELLKTDGPHPPREFMTLDGTLYVDPDGQPWMVYCHEWIQVIDGTFEAVRLTEDLAGTVGAPIHLFKASDGPWLATQREVSTKERLYVSDGAELFRTKEGRLLMLWSSHTEDGYIQTVARSKTGTLAGPWEQLDPLVGDDSGHGMLFRTFDGQLMLVLHQPFGARARANLYEMEDAGDHLRVVRPRDDLDGRRLTSKP